MEKRQIKFNSLMNKNITLKVIPGHFSTSYAHVNYYIDMTSLKTRASEAEEVAKTLAKQFSDDAIIDTIVCMDGCEVIGGFLAKELSEEGILSMNSHKTIYVISPETNANGQMIFRDNNKSSIKGKHILVLVASVTTGSTVCKCLECLQYYGGIVQGVSAIFSVVDKVDAVKINSIFTEKDITGYKNYDINDCPFCKNNEKVEAIINGYGYIKI